MSRRVSTNEKLERVINSKDYDEDDDKHMKEVEEEEAKARERVRKNAFYGQGSRAKIPKVKVKKLDADSPFTVLQPIQTRNATDLLDSAVQPGAHQDQYRLMRYPTEKSRQDPDRVFYTTTGFTEGINFSHQPPWYYGYENKTKPADSNMLMAATRYGYRGSKDIKQRHTNFYEPPSRTRNEHTPKFLDGNDLVDEWVPPILAAKYQTVNNLETPKLWPSSAEFVSGFPKKKLPTSVSYNRETTVGLDMKPELSAPLSTVIDSDHAMHLTLLEYAKQEHQGKTMSVPMATQVECDSRWKERVAKTANPTLKQTMKRVLAPYEAHTLADPSDTMRYSGSTAMIVHTQSSEEVKFRLRMQQANCMIPYDLRWKQVCQQFKQIKLYVKKDISSTALIHDTGRVLRRDAKAAGTPNSVNRVQFIHAMGKLHCFETITQKMLSSLFSVFDPMKRNCVRYVEFVAALGALDQPLDPPLKKLGYLWDIHAQFGDDQPALSIALAVLSTCVSNELERRLIDELFKKDFKTVCYQMSVEQGFQDLHVSEEVDELLSSLPKVGRPSTVAAGTNTTSKGGGGNGSRPNTTGGSAAGAGGGSGAYRMTGAASYQHNISDKYLNRETFLACVCKCEALLDTFDKQLSRRLAFLYGKDARYETDEVVDTGPDLLKDFSWILDNKKATAAAFAAAAAAAQKQGNEVHGFHLRHAHLHLQVQEQAQALALEHKQSLAHAALAHGSHPVGIQNHNHYLLHSHGP